MKNGLIMSLILVLFLQTLTNHAVAQEDESWQQLKGRLYLNTEGELGFATDPRVLGLSPAELGERCKNVFLTTIGSNYETSLNEVIDTASFEELSADFFKDKNFIYRYHPMCEGGYLLTFSNDTENFRILNSQYAIHDTMIFFRMGNEVKADYNTFAICTQFPIIAKDKNGYFEWGQRVTEDHLIDAIGGEDFKNLEFIKDTSYCTKTRQYTRLSNVFFKGNKGKIYIKTRRLIRPPEEEGPEFFKEVPVADVESYVDLSGYYAKDNVNVYIDDGTTDGRNIVILEEADVETFSVIQYRLGRDKNYVFYNGVIVEDINVDSLVILCNKPNSDFSASYYLIKDDKSVYYKNWKMETIDATSFECIQDDSIIIYQDKNWIYEDGYFPEKNPEKRTKRN